MSSCQCRGIQTLFDDKVARRDLRRYRRKGPLGTTRILLDSLVREGVRGATLLDIGGGVGVIPNELMGAGVERAVAVDASPAYLEAARSESERQGHAARIAFRFGDFVAVAPQVAPADVVTLDRVICCYPDMEALVSAAAARTRKLLGVVYPRDTWWDRLGVSLVNLTCRLRRSPFRVFVHSPEAVERVIEEAGLTCRFHRTTPVWQVAVFGR